MPNEHRTSSHSSRSLLLATDHQSYRVVCNFEPVVIREPTAMYLWASLPKGSELSRISRPVSHMKAAQRSLVLPTELSHASGLLAQPTVLGRECLWCGLDSSHQALDASG